MLKVNMNDYLEKGKEILQLLIRNGFEAYFIGDVVRANIMNLPFEDVEINTSATPDALKGIFSFTKVEPFTEATVKVKYYSYDFYISTFRTDKHKGRRDPELIHYSKNLLDDLKCRDFTINAIAMSPSRKMTDAYNGYRDIKKKRVVAIGKASNMFSEEPVQMIRALRFVSELNFKLSREVRWAIRRRRKELLDVEFKLLLPELRKLLDGKYYSKALSLMISFKLYKYVPSLKNGFKAQYNNYRRFKKLTITEFLVAAFVSNGEVDERYLDLVMDKENFYNIFTLALANKKSKYTQFELYENGKAVCLSANKVNWALNKSRKYTKKINANYKLLAIKSPEEIDFTKAEINQLVGEEEITEAIWQQVAYRIINNELANDHPAIKAFIINYLKELKIKEVDSSPDDRFNYRDDYVVEKAPINLDEELRYSDLESAQSESEMEDTLKKQGDIIRDYTQHRLDLLERRINEQERKLEEKDRQISKLQYASKYEKINKDIESLIGKNFEMLKEMDYLQNPQEDKVVLSKRLH